MEEDRTETNLGPETPAEIEAAASIASKQPKRRFVGRRAAEQRAVANATTQNASSKPTSNPPNSLTNPRPPRVTRTLNSVPQEVLEDPAINEAIGLLPSNYNFEIHKTIHRIRSSNAHMIALQFPEGLLMFAPMISDILTQFCPGTDTLIMGDVTYGACCVDDYTARALGCDLLVHYGHSCLVPVDQTGGIKTLYVFVTIGIDVEHLIRTVERNFQPGKRMALVGTIQFNTTLHAIVPRLKQLGYDAVLPRSAPLSAGEILGCTAPTLTARDRATTREEAGNIVGDSDQRKAGKVPVVSDADMILYVGDGRFHLESILISSPTLRTRTYRYDPYSRRLTHETYEHEEMHDLRSAAIREAKRTLRRRQQPSTSTTAPAAARADATGPPSTWGIILGTLGRQGNSHTMDLIRAHLARRGAPCITLLLSEVQPAKLALMSRDVGVWVQIACPRLSIDWGYAFERPLLSPYEALVALGVRDGKWVDDGEGNGGGEQKLEGEVREDGTTRRSSVGGHCDNAADADGDDKTRPTDAGDSAPPPPQEQQTQRGVEEYPMDFYEKSGLGRTSAKDVPDWSALEVEVR